jgi:hypothetical protein
MTRNGGFKHLVRERARRTGESYSTARSHLRPGILETDAELVTRYAAPIVTRMRDADPVARAAVAPSLSRDQGALLAFWILFVHTDDGLRGLCRTHAHRLVASDFWTLIQTGLRDDAALFAIVARLRNVVERAVATAPERGGHGWLELLNTKEMDQLETEFEEVMPASLCRMADYIRADEAHFSIREVTAE